MEQKTYTFHVHGMHCNACVILIEDALNEIPGITRVHADLANHAVTVTGSFDSAEEEVIADLLTTPIKTHGYTLSREKQKHNKNIRDLIIAIPITLGFVVLFVALQRLGVVNLVGGGVVTYGTAFVIGLIASVSTCMAVVGGLVLSLSATAAKHGSRNTPQLLFHIGRIISFFILGGAIGALGAAFTLNATGTFTLGVIIGVVMLILGINLLDIFPWVKRLQPSMPKYIAKRAHNVSKLGHSITPLLIGIATFFLPCGFTQSMQLYTLSTGSFLKGGMTMLAFALGTFPVLAFISISSFRIQQSKQSGVFFKSAGLIVILFALFNIINAFVAIGLIPPVFTL